MFMNLVYRLKSGSNEEAITRVKFEQQSFELEFASTVNSLPKLASFLDSRCYFAAITLADVRIILIKCSANRSSQGVILVMLFVVGFFR